MAVIAGRRAKEFQVLLLPPWLTAGKAVCHTARHSVKHHIEAGVPAKNNMARIDIHHFCKYLTDFRQPVRHAIVTAIRACGSMKIRFGIQDIQHLVGKVKLCRAWFATRHIKAEFLSLNIIVFFLQLFFFTFELCF